MMSDSQIIKYIGDLFNIRAFKNGSFHRWGTACDYILDNGISVPEGLTSSILVNELENIAGSVWTISKRSRLLQCAEEFFNVDEQCYLLARDPSKPAADSLFLIACGMYNDSNEVRDDATYHIKSWSSYDGSIAGPQVISGGKKLGDRIFFVQALHLSSVMCKNTWEENL